MKLKTLAMVAASGLMAASFAYVVPAYAAEYSGDEEVMAPQQLAMADNSSASRLDSFPGDNNNANNGSFNTADNNANAANAGGNNGANNTTGNDANRVDTSTSANANNINRSGAHSIDAGTHGGQANEQGTPDVASGDDDY